MENEMSLETFDSNHTRQEAYKLNNRVLSISWIDLGKAFDGDFFDDEDLSKGYSECIKYICDNHKDYNTTREKVQTLIGLVNSWWNPQESLQVLKNPDYINNDTEKSDLSDEEKAKLNEDFKTIWITNSVFINELLQSGDPTDKSHAFILLDTLIWIKKGKWQILNWIVELRNSWVENFNRLYPGKDTNSITIDWIIKNLWWEQVKNSIKNALNERVFSNLSIWDRDNFDNLVENIRNRRDVLNAFLDYYNYEQLYEENWQAISISNLWQNNTVIIRKKLKERWFNNGFAVQLTKAEENRIKQKKHRQRLQKRRQRLKYIERENSKISVDKGIKKDFVVKTEKSHAYDNLSGKDIASSLDIWNNLLNKFSLNTDIDKNDSGDSRTFTQARIKIFENYGPLLGNKFSKNRSSKKDFPINAEVLYKETNNFQNFDWNTRTLNLLRSLCDKSEFKNVCSALRWFNNYLSEAQDDFHAFNSKVINKNNSEINNKAIGSVIDGIRNIFSNLWNQDKVDNEVQGILLDKNVPVELNNDGDWLVINWTFKWERVKIKYDLISWNIYMNTCISETDTWGTIVFGGENTNIYLWTIENFASIMDMYETTDIKPRTQNIELNNEKQHEDMLNSQIKSIWKLIKNELETNQVKNEASTNFLKTLWIIDNKTGWIIQFESWSDAYKVMQIINNSAKDDVKLFMQCMGTITKYAWKIWGSNQQDFNSDEYREYKEYNDNKDKLGDEWSDKYGLLKYFWEKITTAGLYKWQKWKVDGRYKNWLASIIFEKLKSWEEPNRKLDQNEINKFVNNFKEQCHDACLSLSFIDAWI